MISRLEVKNFQALKNVSVDLGRFTVVVGDSNCGKSALVRALQGLSENIRGSSFVTHGSSVSSITAVLDTAKVTLEKGDGHGVYRTVTDSGEREYTKLAGMVPEDVKSLLGFEDINFSLQHDTPYLLKDSGSVVARVLGDLTNVSTVFEAVREANRRRSTLVAELKTRQRDQIELATKLNDSRNLTVRKSALIEAESIVKNVNSLYEDIKNLENLIELLEYDNVFEESENVDIGEIEKAFQDYLNLKALALTVIKTEQHEKECLEALIANSKVFDQLHAEFEESLKEAKECPMCGNSLSPSK